MGRDTHGGPAGGRRPRAGLVVVVAVLGAVAAMLTGSAHGLLTDSVGVGSNTFATAACFSGAAVNTVQKGTATNTANGTQTVTITAVDTSKAFVTFTTRHNSDRPVGSTVRVRLASSTSLEIVRVTDESVPATIVVAWTVVEYRCGVSVQHGDTTQGATTVNVTISAVPSLAQAFVLFSKAGNPTAAFWNSDDPVIVDLTTTTNLAVRSTNVLTDHVVSWQVVSFSSAAAVNVQRLTLSIGAGSLSASGTLGTAVDLSRTFVVASVRADGSYGPSSLGSHMVRTRLTSTTGVSVDRDTTSSLAVPEIAVQVVELREGSLVTTGSVSMASGISSATGTLVGVDTSRAAGVATMQTGAGLTGGSTPYTADDIPGVSAATVVVTSSSVVTLTRSSTVSDTTIVWQVIEWGGPSWWNTAWQQRYPVVVRTTSSSLPASYSVSFAFDHAALVTASDSLASGNDVRVVRYDGATWTELDRYLDPSSSWNSATTRLWVRLPVTMTTNSTYSRLFVYATNPAAGSPPANASNVFQFYEGFEGGTLANWTATDGGSSFSVATDQAARGSHSVKVQNVSSNQRYRANGVAETDVAVSASLRVAGGNNPLDLMLGLRAQSGSQGDEYHINVWDGSWTLGKVRLASWTYLAGVGGVPTLNAWERIGVQAVGTSLAISVNGTTVATATDSDVSAAGSVSLQSWALPAGSTAWFDEVIARRLVATEPTVTLGAALWR